MGNPGVSEALRDEIRSFLRIGATPAAPSVEIGSSAEQDGYVLERIALVTDDDSIPALLGVPGGKGPFPAVVVFHQHAGQRHLGKSEVFGLAGDPRQAFGPALARAGCIVLAPDAVCFEDRRPGGPGTDERGDDWLQHYNALAYRLVNGDTLMRKVLADAMSVVSALIARPDVDPARVAVVGHSYGGTTALFLSAVDDRVRFGCASGALASYRRAMADRTGIEMAKVIPGFATRFDMADVLAAVAPRPFLVVSGTVDEHSVDAGEIIGVTSSLVDWSPRHVRVAGGHTLDDRRFMAIIDWTTTVLRAAS